MAHAQAPAVAKATGTRVVDERSGASRVGTFLKNSLGVGVDHLKPTIWSIILHICTYVNHISYIYLFLLI